MPAAIMNVASNKMARLRSATLLPSLERIFSTFGFNLRSSHQSRAPPPMSIGKVIRVGRYIPRPNDVPIPVAHSAKHPSAKPSARAFRSPSPSASRIVKVANAFACGATRSILPSASRMERKMPSTVSLIDFCTTSQEYLHGVIRILVMS